MTREEVLKELDKAFHDFKFFAEDHHYEFKGIRIGISATRLIEQYTNEFDKELIAERVAKRDKKTVKQVLKEWQYKNEFATTKGSTCHEYVQSLWSGEQWFCNNFDFSPEYENAIFKIKEQADRFYHDYKNKWEHVADEYIIGSEEYNMASAVDHLFLDRDTGELLLIDYKTNTYMSGHNKEAYKKPMKTPFKHLNDDALTHYKIQLSMYKYIIEKYTKLKIKDLIIVYLSEVNDNYELIKLPYLKEEVKDIFEWRELE